MIDRSGCTVIHLQREIVFCELSSDCEVFHLFELGGLLVASVSLGMFSQPVLDTLEIHFKWINVHFTRVFRFNYARCRCIDQYQPIASISIQRIGGWWITVATTFLAVTNITIDRYILVSVHYGTIWLWEIISARLNR